MARSINPKCLECSNYSIEQARLIHGPDGDNCWVEEHNRCKKLRWQYRNRAEQMAKRRLRYHLQQEDPEVDPVRFSIPQRPTAVRIIFSDDPEHFKKNVTLVLAIEFQLWVGTDCYTRRAPIPCWGMRGDQVAHLMQQILAEFSEDFSHPLNQGKPFKKFLTIHKHIRDCSLLSPWRLE